MVWARPSRGYIACQALICGSWVSLNELIRSSDAVASSEARAAGGAAGGAPLAAGAAHRTPRRERALARLEDHCGRLLADRARDLAVGTPLAPDSPSASMILVMMMMYFAMEMASRARWATPPWRAASRRRRPPRARRRGRHPRPPHKKLRRSKPQPRAYLRLRTGERNEAKGAPRHPYLAAARCATTAARTSTRTWSPVRGGGASAGRARWGRSGAG